MNNKTYLYGGIIIAILAITGGLVLLNDSDDDSNSPLISLSNNNSLGSFIIDNEGMTLYYFANDVPGSDSTVPTSNCPAGCAVAWPLFYEDDFKVSSDLVKSDFTPFDRIDGEKQISYKGWPLYYFIDDLVAGDTNGENVNNIWFVMKPDYAVMLQFNEVEGVNYLVDTFGRSLYRFTVDTKGNDTTDPQSMCLDECLTNWPVFRPATPIAPSFLDSEEFEFIDHPESGLQLAYKGQLLYYFINDQQSGDILGQGVGGVWFIVEP